MIINKDGTMKNNINETITFDDLLLVPQYSEILSRKTIDLSSDLDMNRKFFLPIISSPMDTVTGATMARAMYKVQQRSMQIAFIPKYWRLLMFIVRHLPIRFYLKLIKN